MLQEFKMQLLAAAALDIFLILSLILLSTIFLPNKKDFN